MEEIVHVFIFVGSLQSFFFVSLILSKKRKSSADFWFLALLLAMGVGQLLHYLRWEGYLELYLPNLLRVRFLFPAFIGPLFFFFVSSNTKSIFSRKLVFLSLLPGIINVLLLVPYLLLDSEIKIETPFKVYAPSAYYIHYFISRVSLILFSLLAYLRLSREPLNPGLGWLKRISTAMLANGIVLLAINVIDFFFVEITSYYYINVVNTLLVFVIGFFTLRNSRFFAEENSERTSTANKYERSGLSPKMAEELLDKMDVLMLSEARFRDQNITQSDIAAELNTSTNYLSQALNQIRGKKFTEYVNAFRIDDFKEKVEDSSFKKLTLLAIAESCGFGSKASFNTVFKKVTGQTPSEYLKSKGSILQE